MSTMDKLAKELKSLMSESDERKPKAYDTQAEVIRVDGDTAWVHIPGGVQETPVRLTINAKKGDTVNVHVANGSAWITGNATSPPTDDAIAIIARETAAHALSVGEMAVDDANRARIAADIAESSAEEAASSAVAASNMANAAQYNLSEIEKVVDVVNWISSHGTYVLTTDDTVIEGKFYYSLQNVEPVTDTKVDKTKAYYIRTGTGTDQDPYVYIFVDDPIEEYLSTYFLLTFISITPAAEDNPSELYLYELDDVSSSISNYVASHLSLDNEGLVIKTDGVSTSVRITAGGVILRNENGINIAKFSESVILGDENGVHVTLSPGDLNNPPELGFYEGPDKKVAYINSDTLKITKAEIETLLRIGEFEWKIQDANRISLVYSPRGV